MEHSGILGSVSGILGSVSVKSVNSQSPLFYCEACDYRASKKHHLAKHFLTRKHQLKVSGHSKEFKEPEKKDVRKCPKIYECEYCRENGVERTFQTKSGRYRHVKKCEFNLTAQNKKLKEELEQANQKISQHLLEEKDREIKLLKKTINIIKGDEVKEVVEQQAKTIVNLNLEKKDVEIKLLKKTINIMKEGKGNTNINTQNNTKINNNISINLFLDKHCKNAMPIMDFIRNLQFTLAGINPDRPNSTIEAVSKQLIEGMKDLGETKRPIHCSDTKRQVFYVKDASGWEKDEDNKKIDKAIGWANMRHQAAWHTKAEREGLAKTNKDDYYLKMNVAMGTWSDNVKKSKKKVRKALASNTKIKEAMNKV